MTKHDYLEDAECQLHTTIISLTNSMAFYHCRMSNMSQLNKGVQGSRNLLESSLKSEKVGRDIERRINLLCN